MNKALASIALALGGSFTIIGGALPAHAYPEITFEADVSHVEVHAADDLVSHSEFALVCDWTHEFNGQKQEGKGKQKDSTWSVPEVSEPTVMPVTFTCAYDSASAGRAAPGASVVSRTIEVTVLPGASAQRSASTVTSTLPEKLPGASAPRSADTVTSTLPETGGPNGLVLLSGVSLLLLGGSAAWLARRRAARL